jgi:hypothetical protein
VNRTAPTPTPTKSRTHRPLCRDYGVDPRSLELAAGLAEHQREISAHDGAMLGQIAEYNRSEAWRGDGCLSMQAWLVAHLSVSGARARTLVAASEHVNELPLLCAALCEGRLTLDVFAPIASVNPQGEDAQLAEVAVLWTPTQARDWAEARRGKTDEDSARDFAQRRVCFNDRSHTLTAALTKDSYALVKAALQGAARQGGHLSATEEGYEPFAARCADALVDRCTKGGGSRGGGVGPTVVVHADLERLLHGDGYGTAFINGVGPISAEVARRLACEAELILSLDGADGTCLDQKSFGRHPTPEQRRQVARRDQGCRYPGCAWDVTDVHHIVWASKQGPTVLSNLLTLCKAHHSRVHELGWTLDGDANAVVTFTGPTGQPLTSVPSPTWRITPPMRR